MKYYEILGYDEAIASDTDRCKARSDLPLSNVGGETMGSEVRGSVIVGAENSKMMNRSILGSCLILVVKKKIGSIVLVALS